MTTFCSNGHPEHPKFLWDTNGDCEGSSQVCRAIINELPLGFFPKSGLNYLEESLTTFEMTNKQDRVWAN